MEKIGIYLKAKNFLVYQGQVESIAIKNAKELTQVFEEISRSIELKEEYEKLKDEMEKAEKETQENFVKKKGVAAQKKEAKMEKEEAEKYQKLRKELRENELQLRLFQLYYNEKEAEDIRDELEKRQKDASSLGSKHEKIEHEIRERKKAQGQETREINKVEEQIKDLELKLGKKKPQFIKAKESSMHIVKKLETAKTCYETAQKAHNIHLEEIKRIESELKDLGRESVEFEREIERQTQSQGTSLEERQSQMREYQRLREEAAKRNNKIQEQLSTLQREQKLDQDSLDNENRKRNDISSKIKQKEGEIEEHRTKLNKLIEYIASTEKQIADYTGEEQKLSFDVENSKQACKGLEDELVKVMNEIGDARIDKFESSRNQKKTEVCF